MPTACGGRTGFAGVFADRFGQPTRTFLIGNSLGSLITLGLVERYPGLYHGALATCGIVGGTARTAQYLGDVRALFDFFYPGVLPGGVDWMPSGVDPVADIIVPAQLAITSNPTGAFVISSIDQTRVPAIGGAEIGQSVITALVFHARGVNDLKERSHGRLPYANATVTYTTSVAALQPFVDAANAGVARFTLAADADQWLEQNYEPSGKLDVPVLTLHTTRDPMAPIFHEALLSQKAADAGRLDNLVRREVDVFGHCALTAGEIMTAFTDLATWVNSGVKPAP